MKNKLTDLNNHLFAQLERLGDESLCAEKLASEVTRSKAVTDVAKEVIAAGKLQLDAQKALGENMITHAPPVLELVSK